MSYLINNQQKINDIIFAHRNKTYGAYLIRSTYGETVLKSLSIMILGLGSLLATVFYLNHKNDHNSLPGIVSFHDSTYVIPVYFPPEEIIKPEEIKIIEPPAAAAKTAITSLSTKIVDSTRFENSDTTLQSVRIQSITTEIKSDAAGNPTVNGSAVINNSVTTHTKSPGGIKSGLEIDTAPEFEGGLPALYRFISSHLKYPEIASREGQEGKVYVSFVVDENGNVGSLTLLNRVGFGMDEEALRVVSLLPKFKTPAKVKGEPVKVYYQLPIRFNYR